MPYPLYLATAFSRFSLRRPGGAVTTAAIEQRAAPSRLKPVIKAVDRFHFIATLSSANYHVNRLDSVRVDITLDLQ